MAKGRVQSKSKVKQGKILTQEELEEIDPDKPLLVPNRSNKRQAKIHKKRKPAGASVHQILLTGKKRSAKTGQPEWFRRMKYEAEVKRQLMKVPMENLQLVIGDIATDVSKAGYKTVWDVSQVTDVNEFLKHGKADDSAHGIRVRDLQKLHSYLSRANVPLKWSV